MIKGLGAGMLSGGVVGAIVMSGLSLYAPLPQDRIDAAPKLEATTTQPDTATPTQSAPTVAPTQEDAPVAETEDAASVPAETSDENVEVADAPVVASESETPTAEVAGSATASSTSADTTVAATPTLETSAPAETATAAPATDEALTVTAEVDAPVAAPSEPPAAALDAQADATIVKPDESASPRIIGEEQVADAAEDVAAEPTQTASLAAPKPTPSLPSIGTSQTETAAEPASADTPIVLPTPDVPGVVTNRLPSVGGSAAAPATPAPEAVVEEAPASDLGALEQFATPVEATEGKSLMAFILIDSGENGLPRADLQALAVPVTIALDPVMDNAAAIMAEYRAAGIEVVALANDLPVSAGPGDVATAVSAYFDVLSQSVALMDPLDARIQSNRSLLQPVLGAIRDTGHGLITYDRGLNTAQQAAQRENIPAATVFRVLDADLEESPRIKRYLDRAAFAANQDGAVVVVGRSYSDTVKAMVEWSLEKKDASIAIVPVSAIMKAGGQS